MALTKKNTPSLVETLTAKADQLDATATTKTSQSNALALQAAEAAEVAQVAREHAAAIDQALGILSDAGVTV
ncbi:hypothetical protein SEA_FRANKLIN22_66 [Microbacterium phage Franklin22]|uniref:hypothetical protein n=1 Tax=Microbacterium phage Franklin22 TaxID=2894293 RepID=UPI001E6C37BA|nr:hypothetical protein QDW15_gp66 [Microbacterium phage Franklin22]UGL61879.1 hypothetical protein SEA_FRANKLIN22_66 [Microbacterium phage Franklin22]